MQRFKVRLMSEQFLVLCYLKFISEVQFIFSFPNLIAPFGTSGEEDGQHLHVFPPFVQGVAHQERRRGKQQIFMRPTVSSANFPSLVALYKG